MKTTIDYNTPPLAAVTGVVRLRNGEAVPVRRHPRGEIVEHDTKMLPRTWYATGEQHVGSRSLFDIVAQVSVGPTGPGVYEVATGKVHLHGKDERGWYEALRAAMRWDDFGRPIMLDGRQEPRLNLHRRTGDLPVPDAPSSPSYPASEGRAAMDALMHEPFRDACWRLLGDIRRVLWTGLGVRLEAADLPVLVAALAPHTGDFVPVPRDDLRELFDGTLRAVSPSPQFAGITGYLVDESTYRALSRAAVALGETLPEWMREHATREKWTT